MHQASVGFQCPECARAGRPSREISGKALVRQRETPIVTNALISRIAQRVLTNIDLLRKGGTEGAIDALKGLLR